MGIYWQTHILYGFYVMKYDKETTKKINDLVALKILGSRIIDDINIKQNFVSANDLIKCQYINENYFDFPEKSISNLTDIYNKLSLNNFEKIEMIKKSEINKYAVEDEWSTYGDLGDNMYFLSRMLQIK